MHARGALILVVVFSLSPWPLSRQNGFSDFDAFFGRFKAAVTQKDKATLSKLMAPRFDFILAQNVAPADVFDALDANGGQQWSNLQRAVEGQPVAYN